MTDEELIARLREDVFYGDERLHNLSRHNPLHMEAAERIEALVRQVKDEQAAKFKMRDERDAAKQIALVSITHGQDVEARAERLEAALQKLACKCPSNCDWERDDICPSWIARAALKGADHE